MKSTMERTDVECSAAIKCQSIDSTPWIAVEIGDPNFSTLREHMYAFLRNIKHKGFKSGKYF